VPKLPSSKLLARYRPY